MTQLRINLVNATFLSAVQQSGTVFRVDFK